MVGVNINIFIPEKRPTPIFTTYLKQNDKKQLKRTVSFTITRPAENLKVCYF